MQQVISILKKRLINNSLSLAAARHRIEAGYEVEEVCKYFDFVSVMTCK